MRIFALTSLCILALSSCDSGEKTINVSETRERTLFDERFSADIKDHPPLSWRAIPTTQFRLKNYLTGPNEEVQIAFGIVQGEVLGNANRWLGQFGVSPAANLDFFGKVPVLGAQAYLVEAEGDFGGGMGQKAKADQALVGIIRPQRDNVITIKMTGPREAVAAARDELLEYAKSLEVHSPQITPKENQFQLPQS